MNILFLQQPCHFILTTILITPFCKWRNWSIERLSNAFWSYSYVSGRARIWTLTALFLNLHVTIILRSFYGSCLIGKRQWIHVVMLAVCCNRLCFKNLFPIHQWEFRSWKRPDHKVNLFFFSSGLKIFSVEVITIISLRREDHDTGVYSLLRTIFCPFRAMSFPVLVFTFYKVFLQS